MLVHEIGANKKIRDPIYGYIWLTKNETRIIDTPLFQRLRRVHQLALSKYVYPTAEHSRFVHSLGVMQSATNVFINLYKNNQEILDKVLQHIDIKKYFKTLRYAALLHDIGHLPFSHSSESVLLNGTGKTHEDITKFIIETYSPISDILLEDDIDIPNVSTLIKGSYTSDYIILKRIISHELDVDRADFLLRDSYFCGVEYGNFDYTRYVLSFKITDNNGLSFDVIDGNLPLIEAFILARFYFYLQVPYHRTRVGFDIALGEYIKELHSQGRLLSPISFNNGNLTIDFDLFHDFDDYYMFELIKEDFKKENYWAKILLRQGHLKPLFESNIGEEKDEFIAKSFVKELTENGFTKDLDFFTHRRKIDVHKLVDTSDEDENNKINIVNKNGERIGDVANDSLIIGKFEESPINLFRIFVKEERYSEAERLYTAYKQNTANTENVVI